MWDEIMKIFIDHEIFRAYPAAKAGFVVADIVVTKSDPYIEQLKNELQQRLAGQGITKETWEARPEIVGWRRVFETFVMGKGYCASVESLVRRVVNGQKIWNISTVVDLYNCCSALSLVPMGGYDMTKIAGDIVVRYGKAGEVIAPLGASESFSVADNHVVYADDEKVLCWLWNYRDSRLSCIDQNSKRVIFFLDEAFEVSDGLLRRTLADFVERLEKIGARVVASGIVDAVRPEINLNRDAV